MNFDITLKFWKETSFDLCEFCKKNIETNNINILLEPLLYNIKVKILNKYVLCKTLYEKEFHIAHDLFVRMNSLVIRE